jgi:hypothetical protein
MMKITVSISIEIEEADGDGNTFALTRAASCGDNPSNVYGEAKRITEPAMIEALNRVTKTYPVMR